MGTFSKYLFIRIPHVSDSAEFRLEKKNLNYSLSFLLLLFLQDFERDAFLSIM